MNGLTPSKVLGDDCRALASELLTQPELLGGVFLDSPDRLLPEAAERVAVAKRYTGERSTSDDHRLVMVGALRLLGASDREIARTCGVTSRTIPLLLRELERTGRVTALKDRLAALVGDNAERSSLLLRQLMEKAMDGEVSMELASMLKAVGSVNCFQVEKHQLLTGCATEIVEQRAGAGRADFERWWREAAIPVDASSVAHPAFAGEMGGNGLDDTAMIREPGPGDRGQERGGGGSKSVGGGACSMDQTGAKF